MAGRRFLALIAVLACVLAGCSDAESDDDPAPMPTEPSTSDVRETVEVPTPPKAARKETLKGAEAFVRHYIELLNYAANTGKVHPLIANSSRSCGGCFDYAQAYRKTYERGGFVRTSGWRPTSVFSVHVKDHVVVLVDVRAPDIKYALRAGDPKKIGKGGIYKLRFETSRRNGEWTISSLTEQQGV